MGGHVIHSFFLYCSIILQKTATRRSPVAGRRSHWPGDRRVAGPIPIEPTIIFKLVCFISQFKFSGSHDSFDMNWNITTQFLLFLSVTFGRFGQWPFQLLRNNHVFIIFPVNITFSGK